MTDLKFWSERWNSGNTKWDLGGPHPLLSRVVAVLKERGNLKSGARIYVPGCGRAHDAAALAEAGFLVTAVDFVADAIRKAKALYAERPGLTLRVEDVFSVPEFDESVFDAVFDRAMLNALPPELRVRYVHGVTRRLSPGGLFASLPFTLVSAEKEPPPFATSRQDVAHLFQEHFDFVHWEEGANGRLDGVIRSEAITVLRKRIH